MATMNAPAAERRHTPERRVNSGTLLAEVLSPLDWVAMAVMIMGGISWGLVGAFDVDILATAFGIQAPLTRLVYALVGIASLYGVYLLTKLGARH